MADLLTRLWYWFDQGGNYYWNVLKGTENSENTEGWNVLKTYFQL